jgi:hypothetical protein
VQLVIFAAIANQTAYSFSPETERVMDAKLAKYTYDFDERIG